MEREREKRDRESNRQKTWALDLNRAKNNRDELAHRCFSLLLPKQKHLLQVSDAILDACLEQDPDAKVRRDRERENEKDN